MKYVGLQDPQRVDAPGTKIPLGVGRTASERSYVSARISLGEYSGIDCYSGADVPGYTQYWQR